MARVSRTVASTETVGVTITNSAGGGVCGSRVCSSRSWSRILCKVLA